MGRESPYPHNPLLQAIYPWPEPRSWCWKSAVPAQLGDISIVWRIRCLLIPLPITRAALADARDARIPTRRRNYQVWSYGTGAQVKMPGPKPEEPNVYEFVGLPALLLQSRCLSSWVFIGCSLGVHWEFVWILLHHAPDTASSPCRCYCRHPLGERQLLLHL